MNIPFVKMHANGNDFVIIDNREKNYKFQQTEVSRLSNRNTGIGFDQLILLEKSKNKDILMKIINSDGTEAKMCGNAGICVASMLFASRKTNSITIETISCDIYANLETDGKVSITIKLPPQTFSDIITDKRISIENVNLSRIHNSLDKGILVNMGNPHIVFVVNSLEELDLSKYGGKIEKNKLFSDGINTEIVEIINRSKLKVRFWERGAGMTFSCGSGILSAFYACYKSNLCEEKVEVIIPFGKVNTNIKDTALTMSTLPQVTFVGELYRE
ncbi:MAG: diaminopimelate epimerase [Pseudomonadota bacterium]|nr:diaminopimelate epimerase [Pseudomonadota bacterium]